MKFVTTSIYKLLLEINKYQERKIPTLRTCDKVGSVVGSRSQRAFLSFFIIFISPVFNLFYFLDFCLGKGVIGA